MRVLITGGTGYLGSAIVRALDRAGHRPIVFARHATTASLPGEAIEGDVRDAAAVARAVAKADAICHTAALVSLWRRRPADFDEVNVQGLQNVLDAATAHGIPRIVYTSSFLALPPRGRATALAANDYQRTKRMALEVARAAAAAGAPIVTLFPGVVYGPGPATEGNLVGRLVRDHLAGRLPGIVEPWREWSYSWVDDVAEAHVAALDRGHGEYIAGGENAPQRRVFEIVREVRGVKLPRELPARLVEAAGAIEELRARLTGRPPMVTRGTVEIFRQDWSLDSTRSIDELSLRVTPLEIGVRTLLAAFS